MHFQELFYPRSIAVVGASHEVGSVGNELVKNLVKLDYHGHIYPINPKGGRLYDLKVSRFLHEIEGEIDLAVIAVPAAIVPQVINEVGHKGIKAVIIISAGFKEVGKGELEQDVVRLCQRYGITMVGPNCLGIINPEIKMNASFAGIMPPVGPIAFISQSGAICSSVLDYARDRGLGFSKFLSIGNKAGVNEADLLDYLLKDDRTKVIMMYIEQLTAIPELMKVAQRALEDRPPKPILILKSGNTTEGSHASQSHTGALSGSNDAYNALFAECGMIRADSMEELFQFAECFAYNHRLQGKEIVVVTNAGGPGVLSADALINDGLALAQLRPATQTRLKRFLPAAASVANPIDLLGDADAKRYEKALRLVLHDSGVKGVLVVLTPQSMTQVEATAKVIARIKQKTRKPIIVSFIGASAVQAGVEVLHRAEIPASTFPEVAVKALSALQRFSQQLLPQNRHNLRYRDLDRSAAELALGKAKASGTQLVTTDKVYAILKAYGLPTLKRVVVTSGDEAQTAAKRFSGPIVLKVVSPDISHKSDVGGVMLDVEPKEAKSAYQQLMKEVGHRAPHASIEGVEMMEQLLAKSLEVIVGITTDPVLGKVALVGWGGVYTEVLKDVAWGLLPLSHADTRRMISSLLAFKVMKGARGEKPLDIKKLQEVLGRVSNLAEDFPQIKELDINPLALLPDGQGAKILDARIVLE